MSLGSLISMMEVENSSNFENLHIIANPMPKKLFTYIILEKNGRKRLGGGVQWKYSVKLKFAGEE